MITNKPANAREESSAIGSGGEAMGALLSRFSDMSQRLNHMSAAMDTLRKHLEDLGSLAHKASFALMFAAGLPPVFRHGMYGLMMGGGRSNKGGFLPGSFGSGGSKGPGGSSSGPPSGMAAQEEYYRKRKELRDQDNADSLASFKELQKQKYGNRKFQSTEEKLADKELLARKTEEIKQRLHDSDLGRLDDLNAHPAGGPAGPKHTLAGAGASRPAKSWTAPKANRDEAELNKLARLKGDKALPLLSMDTEFAPVSKRNPIFLSAALADREGNLLFHEFIKLSKKKRERLKDWALGHNDKFLEFGKVLGLTGSVEEVLTQVLAMGAGGKKLDDVKRQLKKTIAAHPGAMLSVHSGKSDMDFLGAQAGPHLDTIHHIPNSAAGKSLQTMALMHFGGSNAAMQEAIKKKFGQDTPARLAESGHSAHVDAWLQSQVTNRLIEDPEFFERGAAKAGPPKPPTNRKSLSGAAGLSGKGFPLTGATSPGQIAALKKALGFLSTDPDMQEAMGRLKGISFGNTGPFMAIASKVAGKVRLSSKLGLSPHDSHAMEALVELLAHELTHLVELPGSQDVRESAAYGAGAMHRQRYRAHKEGRVAGPQELWDAVLKGRNAWERIKRHPKYGKAYARQAGVSGGVTPEEIAAAEAELQKATTAPLPPGVSTVEPGETVKKKKKFERAAPIDPATLQGLGGPSEIDLLKSWLQTPQAPNPMAGLSAASSAQGQTPPEIALLKSWLQVPATALPKVSGPNANLPLEKQTRDNARMDLADLNLEKASDPEAEKAKLAKQFAAEDAAKQSKGQGAKAVTTFWGGLGKDLKGVGKFLGERKKAIGEWLFGKDAQGRSRWDNIRDGLPGKFLTGAALGAGALGAGAPDAFATLKNSFILLAGQFGQMLIPAAARLIVWIQNLAAWFAQLSPFWKKLIGWGSALLIAGFGVVTVLTKLWPILAGFGNLLLWAGKMLMAFGTKMGLSNTAMVVGGIVAAVVAAVAGYMMYQSSKLAEGKKEFDQAWKTEPTEEDYAELREDPALKKFHTMSPGERIKFMEEYKKENEEKREAGAKADRYDKPWGAEGDDILKGKLSPTSPENLDKSLPSWATDNYSLGEGVRRRALGLPPEHSFGSTIKGIDDQLRSGNKPFTGADNREEILKEYNKSVKVYQIMDKYKGTDPDAKIKWATSKKEYQDKQKELGGLQQLQAMVSMVTKAQPTYTSLDQVYQKTQLETLGKDPLQQAIDTLQRGSLQLLLNELKEANGTLGEQVRLLHGQYKVSD